MTGRGAQANVAPEMISLIDLGLPDWVAAGALSVLGPEAAATIAGDPWSVLTVPGVRPEQADAYARSRIGSRARPTDPRRQAALVSWLVRRSALDGHTVVPGVVVEAALAAYGVIDPPAAAAAADATVTGVDGGLALREHAAAEHAIAEAVSATPRPRPPQGSDDPPGGAVVDEVLNQRLAVFTGPPGDRLDGTIRAVAARAREQGRRVLGLAPTANGARRLGQLVGEAVAVPVTGGGPTAEQADVIVVYDSAALDVHHSARLLHAYSTRTVVLCGDVRGLAAVDGPGNVLADLAASGRVWSMDTEAEPATDAATATIAELATNIGRGVLPPVASPGKDVVVVPAGTASEAVRTAVELATDSIPRSIGVSAADVMVLSPAVAGVAGTRELNARLKQRLNPGPGVGAGFDAGDRVVLIAEAHEFGAHAGEVGTVRVADESRLVVDLAGNEIELPLALRGRLRPAWALTVARAAVSRWPACVLLLPAEAAGLLSRALLRTAITRAEQHITIVHAAGGVVARAIRHGRERRRRTMLPALLRGTPGPVSVDQPYSADSSTS